MNEKEAKACVAFMGALAHECMLQHGKHRQENSLEKEKEKEKEGTSRLVEELEEWKQRAEIAEKEVKEMATAFEKEGPKAVEVEKAQKELLGFMGSIVHHLRVSPKPSSPDQVSREEGLFQRAIAAEQALAEKEKELMEESRKDQELEAAKGDLASLRDVNVVAESEHQREIEEWTLKHQEALGLLQQAQIQLLEAENELEEQRLQRSKVDDAADAASEEILALRSRLSELEAALKLTERNAQAELERVLRELAEERLENAKMKKDVDAKDLELAKMSKLQAIAESSERSMDSALHWSQKSAAALRQSRRFVASLLVVIVMLGVAFIVMLRKCGAEYGWSSLLERILGHQHG